MEMKSEKDKLQRLADLMNEQSETPMLVTDDLLYIFDAALEPEEVDFMLKMGGGNLSRAEVEGKVGLTPADFERVLETLLDKGHITELEPEEEGEEPYLHVMSIFPGWFEHYLMRGADTPDRREFSRRVSGYFAAAQAIPPDMLNEILKDMSPHRSLAIANPSSSRLIQVDEAVPPQPSEVHPSHSILNILERLPEDVAVSAGHCFCREQRKLDGDPCRMDLPEESCLGIGPAAEHIIRRGMGRRISKREAIELVKLAEEKGAVHQVGRMVPLKDFKVKHEADIICNCCWDCCGVLGNYHRGNLPFMLKSYYIAEVPDEDECTGCGICEQFCPVDAIAVGESGVAAVDQALCCGCGLCALHCPENAVRLRPYERNVFLPVLPPGKRRIQ